MTRDEISNGYFNWLYRMMCEGRYASTISFRKLLTHLHSIEFTYLIPKDANRAEDGIDLRRRYASIPENGERYSNRIMRALDGPCSVLEMMIALAVRCEETIMDDPAYGDRTRQWFWGMMTSLGLGGMTDELYNRVEVERIVATLLAREYTANGKGGLFTIRHCNHDLREIEIWVQLLWYINSIS
jgi:hypothetical protein